MLRSSLSSTDAPATEAGVGRLHEVAGRPVLTAAAAGQSSYEGDIGATSEARGFFTWAVRDALRNGDTNGNGLIEPSELMAQAHSVVPKITAKNGRQRASPGLRASLGKGDGTIRVERRGLRRATPAVSGAAPCPGDGKNGSMLSKKGLEKTCEQCFPALIDQRQPGARR